MGVYSISGTFIFQVLILFKYMIILKHYKNVLLLFILLQYIHFLIFGLFFLLS